MLSVLSTKRTVGVETLDVASHEFDYQFEVDAKNLWQDEEVKVW